MADLKLETPLTVTPAVTCQQCVDILNKQGYDQLPCVSNDNQILGSGWRSATATHSPLARLVDSHQQSLIALSLAWIAVLLQNGHSRQSHLSSAVLTRTTGRLGQLSPLSPRLTCMRADGAWVMRLLTPLLFLTVLPRCRSLLSASPSTLVVLCGCHQITRCLYTQCQKVGLHTALSKLSEIFDHDHFALVVSSQRCFDKGGAVSEKLMVFGIVTRIDLLNFIVTHRPRGASVSSAAADSTDGGSGAPAQYEHEQKEQASEKKEATSVYSIERM